MNIEKLPSFRKEANPFRSDNYHIGTPIGKNIVIMHPNFPKEYCKYIIIVNKKTGERVKINFDEQQNS